MGAPMQQPPERVRIVAAQYRPFIGLHGRIVETIDNAAHVMQRAMQELNQLRRLRGVA